MKVMNEIINLLKDKNFWMIIGFAIFFAVAGSVSPCI